MTTNRRASAVDVCRWPARVLAEQIRRRQVTSVEALEENLARIAAHNPAVNAVVSLDAERARRWAESADAALDHGDVWGPLHGVPLALKDGHDVAGLRTTMGAPPLDRVAHADGAVAARLRGAGANIIGHTNVSAWLADPLQTENPLFGRTANPWDPGRTPGGSSGGAAAAVAAGMTSFDIGSDLAGSIRLPAHFCGLYGLKPTEHRVPLTGFFRDPADGPRPIRIMACLGPIARDLDDLDLALRVISGPDGKDSDVAPVPIGPPDERRLTEMRFAVAATPPGTSISAITRQMVERVAAGASDAGAMVEERLPEVDWGEMHELFGDLAGAVTGVFSPDAGLRDEQRTLGWYLAALERRDRMGAIWEAWFEDLDCLVLPVAAASAFRHCEQGADIDVEGTTVSYWAFGAPLPASNLTGMPALVVPAGLDETGLPIGVQLVGPRWSEMRLIGIARQLEKAGVLPGFRFPPGY